MEGLPVEDLVDSNRLWLLRTRIFQLDEGSGTFVGTAPAMARPVDLVDNMWKQTTEAPQWIIQILNNGRMSCADRQFSEMKMLRRDVYLRAQKETESGPAEFRTVRG